jgi:hypothetical protein
MVLDPAQLARSLQNDWLPGDEGPFHDDVAASAEALAGAVAGWFAAAQAAGFPCATAAARRPQLKAQALPAIQAADAPAAGQGIALAFAAYVAGQSFGAGAAAPPVATPAGAAMITNALLQRDLPQAARAQILAGAIHTMAISSIVAFPQPPFSAPIT